MSLTNRDLSMALPIGTPAIKDRKQESDFQVVRDSTLIDIPDTFPTEPIKSSIVSGKGGYVVMVYMVYMVVTACRLPARALPWNIHVRY